MNPLQVLRTLGQSVWLDDIRRSMLEDGTLARLIEEDAVAGVTSNPSIFEKAISEGREYDAEIARLAREGTSASTIYETLALADVGRAADLLRPVFDASAGRDGFASLEVPPQLAYDAEATVSEAARLWSALARPNVMIKVPATREGLPAIRRLIAAGINVNATLLFSVELYQKVAEAYLSGLEERAAEGQPLGRVASVASFFVSRIDTLVDSLLDQAESSARTSTRLLRGEAAIACARFAYQHYKALCRSERWRSLEKRGARAQRLLWASTSSKDPTYSDVKYVEALVGPDTVNTMPLTTLEAYRDHGKPAARLEEGLGTARSLLASLQALGIDLPEVARQLEREGIKKFVDSFKALLTLIERRGAQTLSIARETETRR